MISRIVALLVVGLISVSVGCKPAMPWSKPAAEVQMNFVATDIAAKTIPFKMVLIARYEQEGNLPTAEVIRAVDSQEIVGFKLNVVEQLHQLKKHYSFDEVTIQVKGISPSIVAIVQDCAISANLKVRVAESISPLSKTYFDELTKWETPTAEVDSGFVPETLLPDAS